MVSIRVYHISSTRVRARIRTRIIHRCRNMDIHRSRRTHDNIIESIWSCLCCLNISHEHRPTITRIRRV